MILIYYQELAIITSQENRLRYMHGAAVVRLAWVKEKTVARR